MSANPLENRAKAIAAMGLVGRDYEGFNVISPGFRKETFRIWKDEEGRVKCSCVEYGERIANEPKFRCEHILAVKFHLKNQEVATEENNPSATQYFIIAIQPDGTEQRVSLTDALIDLGLIEPPVQDWEDRSPNMAKNMSELVTPRQLVAIRVISNAKGLDAEDVCVSLFKEQIKPEELSRKSASRLIDHLKNQETANA